MDPTTPPAVPLAVIDNFAKTIYGPELLSGFIACLLFGILSLQTFIYYADQPKDPFALKYLPLLVWCMDFAHTFLICSGIWKILISNFASQQLLPIITDFQSRVVLQTLVSVVVQLFFVWRIWRYSKQNHLVFAVFLPFICLQFVVGMIEAITGLEPQNRTQAFLLKERWEIYLVISVNFGIDIGITSCMTFLLKRETIAFAKTRSVVNRLLILTINTGLITTLVSLLIIILMTVNPNNFAYVFFIYILSPLYANVLMANLNARNYVRNGLNSSSLNDTSINATGHGFAMRPIHFGANRSGNYSSYNNTDNTQVDSAFTITKTVETDHV